jgi:hypothetical protein
MDYLTVNLERGDEKRRVRIHTLVIEAFVGPRPGGLEACHGPGGSDDNSRPNLRWDTRRENMLDEVRHGTHHNAVKTHCKRNHEFTPENTRINPTSGSRQCRRCVYEGNKARILAKASAVLPGVAAEPG